jgi:hypothetical protein
MQRWTVEHHVEDHAWTIHKAVMQQTGSTAVVDVGKFIAIATAWHSSSDLGAQRLACLKALLWQR